MYRKSVLLALASMLLLLLIFTQFTMQVKAQLTIYVDASNVGDPLEDGSFEHPFDKIQEGINNASTGDTVFVKAGTYYEHVEVNKTVSLIGENRSTTIIDGSGTWQVIRVRASNAEIKGFTVQNGGGWPYSGIFVGNWTGNMISNNIIRKNGYGVELKTSYSNSIVDNLIVNNSVSGVYIDAFASNNSFWDNTIAYNSAGVLITNSTTPNTFYHNNFINNTNQISFAVPTQWNNSVPEGNYWSDYTGVDTDGDGIGETGTPHLGADYYPLIIPTRPFPVIWDDVIYPVTVISNSTVSGFYFSQPSNAIGFYVTGLSNTTGFCNVTIPRTLMWCDQPGEWQVTVSGASPIYFPPSTNNGTHTFLYFTYNHTNKTIRIISTQVVPEFPAAIFLPLFIIATLVVVTLRKRKHRNSTRDTHDYLSQTKSG